MARARNIKPGFFKNEDLSDLSPHTRLLFIGLWCLADREGFLEDRPKRIKGELFPYENVEVDQCLQELHHAGFIIRYEVDGERFISIPKFKDHQNPHHREAASKIPKPEVGKDKPRAVTDQGKAQPQNSLGLSSEISCLGSDEPTKSPADSLIPDSLNLIPDSLIPDTTTTDSMEQHKSVVVLGGRNLHVFNSVIDQYKHYFNFDPNPTIMQLLYSYLDDGLQMDLLAWVMRYAAEKGKAWDYAKGTLEKMFVQGVRTAEQAEKANQEFQQQQSQKVVPIRDNKLRVDNLPASVQWQMEQERVGAFQSRESPRLLRDDPELMGLLDRMRRSRTTGS
ncbi:DnaD domain protein [Brevibacillus sp. AG]|uniref:DnaD domain-containing protein n=1 Tax=Brevibacillus sp. AG TaxID=3020891 RepID=UPI00232D3A46|nr:DnaD domain protein [Brevibacillus sp. AG]MDC0760591.1 DnaD domain protein [Brevibacillus sp. AG]